MDALALVVVVSEADAVAPATPALLRAAEEALGGRGRVKVRAFGTNESRDAVREQDGTATVVLHWEEGGRRAHVRLHVEKSAPWIERDLGFDERDAPEERGRAVGFALAAMLPEDAQRPRQPPIPPPPGLGAPLSQPVAPTPAQPPPRPPRLDLAVRAQLVGGAGGVGGGAGGSLEGQVFLGRWLAAHATVGYRAAQASRAEGTAHHLRAGAGMSVRVRIAQKLELSPTFDVLVLRDAVSHLSPDLDEPEPVTQSRLLPGARADLRLSWFVTESAALELAIGSEVAFGTTTIFLEGQPVTSIVPVRLGIEPGLRVRF